MFVPIDTEFSETRPRYRAYMLRCWKVTGPATDQPAAWRLSIEDAHTGTSRVFHSLEELVAFLHDEFADQREEP